MIDVKHDKCENIGCKLRAIYNYNTETKARYCLIHKLDNMVNKMCRYCISEWCSTTVMSNKYDGYCLFLKGKNLPLEISQAKQKFSFEFELFPSLTSKESNIIRINKISNLN
jgi:hypothetical protein